jgi:D-glycero-D-manno-heptose 1,7-bisphosphate phosphatase
MNSTPQKAAFIDRDGTLIEEVNFLSRVEDLRIFPFTADALRRLKDAGFLTIVVTNQSGIGRGLYSEEDMHSIHRRMAEHLPGLIDAFHFCPHLPEAGCRCRKPNIGMLEAAESEFSIERAASWMIGDKRLDIETGFKAGTRTALVKTGYGADTCVQLTKGPDLIEENLLDVVCAMLDSARAASSWQPAM